MEQGANDVISGQNVKGVKVVLVTKFDGPSSNRLQDIRFAHFDATATEHAAYPITPKPK